MSESETILCPKGCGQRFSLQKMHEHYEVCLGVKPTDSFEQLVSQIPTWPTRNEEFKGLIITEKEYTKGLETSTVAGTVQSFTTPQAPPPPKPYVEPQRAIKDEVFKTAFCPIHGIEYIETEYYKICIKCKRPKIKPKMFWWFTLRYFLMASWLILLVGFIFGIASYHKLYPP